MRSPIGISDRKRFDRCRGARRGIGSKPKLALLAWGFEFWSPDCSGSETHSYVERMGPLLCRVKDPGLEGPYRSRYVTSNTLTSSLYTVNERGHRSHRICVLLVIQHSLYACQYVVWPDFEAQFHAKKATFAKPPRPTAGICSPNGRVTRWHPR